MAIPKEGLLEPVLEKEKGTGGMSSSQTGFEASKNSPRNMKSNCSQCFQFLLYGDWRIDSRINHQS